MFFAIIFRLSDAAKYDKTPYRDPRVEPPSPSLTAKAFMATLTVLVGADHFYTRTSVLKSFMLLGPADMVSGWLSIGQLSQWQYRSTTHSARHLDISTRVLL